MAEIRGNEDLTCVELRRELAKRGAKTSGRKGELLERY
jgi:hypothetical protein